MCNIVYSIPSDFKNYKSMTIPVHVTKKGAVMQAIGVGFSDLICVDNIGNPCVLTLKNVLCIPEANKSLMKDISVCIRARTPCFPQGYISRAGM